MIIHNLESSHPAFRPQNPHQPLEILHPLPEIPHKNTTLIFVGFSRFCAKTLSGPAIYSRLSMQEICNFHERQLFTIPQKNL
jgi:hypothetical protein